MIDKKKSYEQMTFSSVISSSKDELSEISSSDLEMAIKKLLSAKIDAEKRENKERLNKEKAERDQKEQENRQKREEHIQKVTCMDLPLDWKNIFNEDIRTRSVHFDSISDALVNCLISIGRVDIEYIASVTGEEYKTVICTLKGSIYQNPDTWEECFYKGWETSDEYLSGNLMRKWRSAKKADEIYRGYFFDNIRAIEKLLPPAVTSKDIYVTLGSPWVPPDIIDDFITYLFGNPLANKIISEKLRDETNEYYKTLHDEITGTWEIHNKSRYSHSIAVRQSFGTEKMEALYILEKTLNMKKVAVTNEIVCTANASGKKRVIDKAETIAALEKQQKLIKEFQKWVWSDEKRKERLENIFDNNFGYIRRRKFDGSFLNFPSMSPSVKLYHYQKDAVARILFTPNTLLAHDVGAGKTYIMIAAGQEMLRMGISKKNMYVVPNNIVGQWKSIFLEMYPQASILCVEPKSFCGNKREKILERIRDEEFDGIIVAYSCFGQIPLSKEYYLEELNEEKKRVSDLINQARKATQRLKKKKMTLEIALSDLTHAMDAMYDVVYFDELGITRLFVDEAHNFKNVPIETKVDSVLGISSTGSIKCKDMMDKVHMLQKENDGKGVILATGTPITNSITEVYVIQQYLQSGELAMLDLQNFDSWVGMFAERVTDFEIDVDTNSFRLATRFSKFHNLPELTALLSSVADFHGVDKTIGIPEFEGYSDALISKTPEFSTYLEDISRRADSVRQGYVDRRDDNMLKITTDGRKAALDLRLVEPNALFTYQSKVARCAENVANIYYSTSQDKSTQLVFCDTSTPKASFNIYDELKSKLELLGIPGSQVIFVHDADTEAKRERLFSKVRNGEIRILIGSTFKLGLGVNIQDKLIAIHHIDVPWRPADMTQREGRILRQGNENYSVKIYRYITEGSFDAYSWQLLETKQRFITELLSGSLTERSSADIEGTALDYAEVKALAVGDPHIKERVEKANELSRFTTLQRKLVESRTQMEKELFELPGEENHQKDLIKRCSDDVSYYSEWKQHHRPVEDLKTKKDVANHRKYIRETIVAGLRGNILKKDESFLMDYRGFKIFLPANMTEEKPFIWMKRNGKYYVELGDTEVGNLIRIENYMDDLTGHLDKLRTGLVDMEKRKNEIQRELANKESYADEIEECKISLERIDKELGVTKNE